MLFESTGRFHKNDARARKTKLKKFERFLLPQTANFLNLRSTFCKTPFVNPQSALRPLVCSLHTVARRLHFVHPCNPKPSLRPCTLSLSFLLFLSFVVFPLHPFLCFLFFSLFSSLRQFQFRFATSNIAIAAAIQSGKYESPEDTSIVTCRPEVGLDMLICRLA